MIYDLDGNVITSTAVNVAPDDEKLFSALVDCKPGFVITGSTENPDVGVFARADPGDSWTDILAGSLDTAAFAPAQKQFYFKIEIDGGADPSTEIIRIICARA